MELGGNLPEALEMYNTLSVVEDHHGGLDEETVNADTKVGNR